MPGKDLESDLIKGVMDGDPVAFEKIFEKYHRKVFAFALRSFRNTEDAEGAVQEVFYQLWKDRSNRLMYGSYEKTLCSGNNRPPNLVTFAQRYPFRSTDGSCQIKVL